MPNVKERVVVVHEFAASKLRGDEGEAIFDDFYMHTYPTHVVDSVTLAEDRKGTDRRIWRPTEAQVKTDFQAHETGKVFVELVSNTVTGALGWGRKCLAPELWVQCPGLGLVCRFDWAEVPALVAKWEKIFAPATAKNPTYDTLGVLVPVDVFKAAAAEVQDPSINPKLAAIQAQWLIDHPPRRRPYATDAQLDAFIAEHRGGV